MLTTKSVAPESVPVNEQLLAAGKIVYERLDDTGKISAWYGCMWEDLPAKTKAEFAAAVEAALDVLPYVR